MEHPHPGLTCMLYATSVWHESIGHGQEESIRRTDGRRGRDEGPSRRQDHPADLQSRGDTWMQETVAPLAPGADEGCCTLKCSARLEVCECDLLVGGKNVRGKRYLMLCWPPSTQCCGRILGQNLLSQAIMTLAKVPYFGGAGNKRGSRCKRLRLKPFTCFIYID